MKVTTICKCEKAAWVIRGFFVQRVHTVNSALIQP